MRSDKAGEDDVRLRLERLEKLIEQLAASKGETRIHIEHLHVQQAVLEQMTVRMDQLDVKEVSGSLNIGNNFHTTKGNNQAPRKDESLSSSSKREPAPKSKVEARGGGPGLRPTPNGFTFRFDKEMESQKGD